MPEPGELVFVSPRRGKPPQHLMDLDPAGRRDAVVALMQREARALAATLGALHFSAANNSLIAYPEGARLAQMAGPLVESFDSIKSAFRATAITAALAIAKKDAPPVPGKGAENDAGARDRGNHQVVCAYGLALRREVGANKPIVVRAAVIEGYAL